MGLETPHAQLHLASSCSYARRHCCDRLHAIRHVLFCRFTHNEQPITYDEYSNHATIEHPNILKHAYGYGDIHFGFHSNKITYTNFNQHAPTTQPSHTPTYTPVPSSISYIPNGFADWVNDANGFRIRFSPFDSNANKFIERDYKVGDTFTYKGHTFTISSDAAKDAVWVQLMDGKKLTEADMLALGLIKPPTATPKPGSSGDSSTGNTNTGGNTTPPDDGPGGGIDLGCSGGEKCP